MKMWIKGKVKRDTKEEFSESKLQQREEEKKKKKLTIIKKKNLVLY